MTNITNFGAFIDIGVKQDGLIHISQLSNSFVSDPNQVLKLHQKVVVTVTGVDVLRKRITLSMKDNTKSEGKNEAENTKKEIRNNKGFSKDSAEIPKSFQSKLNSLKKKFN